MSNTTAAPTSAKDYLVALYDGLDDELLLNLVAIQPDGPCQGDVFPLKDIRESDCVETFIAKYDGWNLYFIPNLCKQKPAKGRAAKDDLHDEAWFVFVDCDPPVGSDRDAWRIENEAKFAQAKFTSLVDSGNGFQLINRLEKPVSLDRAQAINKKLRDYRDGDKGAVAFNQPYRLPFTTNHPNETKREKGYVVCPTRLLGLTDERFNYAETVEHQPADIAYHDEQLAAPATVEGLSDIDDDIKHIILTGKRPEGEDGDPFPGRSEARHSVLMRMFQRNYRRERIIQIITDPTYAIAPGDESKLNKEGWWKTELDRAWETVRASIPRYVWEFNDQYFVTMYQGKTVIVEDAYDEATHRNLYRFTTPASLNLYYANDKVRIGRQEKPKSAAWLEHAHRRTYSEMVMLPNLPSGGLSDDRFNMWRGWPVQAGEGDCSLFDELVDDIVCAGDRELAAYIWGWLAHGIQHPEKQAEVALVMRGKRGTGKGTLATIYGKLFSDHFIHISNEMHLTGNFNAHLLDCLCLFCDEALWAGSRKGESTLKALITEELIPIEKKYHDVHNVRNRLKIIMASNEDWVVPAGVDERRFVVTEVSDKRQKDLEWFGKLREQMKNGGTSALLHKLLNLDLSSFEIRKPPVTEALKDQQRRTFDAFQDWWLDELMEGDHGVPDGQDEKPYPWELVPKDHLFESYMRARDKHSRRGTTPTNKHSFGKELMKYMPEGWVMKRGPRMNFYGKKVNTYRLPDLDECRAAFEEATNQKYAWPENDYHVAQERIA